MTSAVKEACTAAKIPAFTKKNDMLVYLTLIVSSYYRDRVTNQLPSVRGKLVAGWRSGSVSGS